MDESIKDLLGTAAKELETLLSTKTVVGEPIVLGDAKIVPIISIGFGMAAAGGKGNDRKRGDGGGAGLGCGGGVKPVAILIQDQNGVRVEAIKGGAASAAETIAETIGNVMASKSDSDED